MVMLAKIAKPPVFLTAFAVLSFPLAPTTL